MKYLLIIGDGMADHPVKELNGLTPLEKCNKPVIDSLAARGELGGVKTIPDGFPPGSDTAIMSIFGCDPQKYYSGRAPLEAAAQGISLEPGDAAFRCNNVALSDAAEYGERQILSHSGGGIEGEDAMELVKWLFSHPEFKPMADTAGMTINPANSYRHICVQKAVNIDGMVMNPPHDHLGEKVSDNLPRGCEDANTLINLMKKATELLETHPINIKRREEGKIPSNGIWFWAEGTAAALPDFKGQYGKTGAVISAVPLCHGIAALVGMDIVLVEGATGELDTNYEGKVEKTLEAIKTHDFVGLHVEAPDECTHCGDLPGKLQAIEWLDSRVTKPIVDAMEKRGEDFRLLMLSDHKTITGSGVHNDEPVPYLIYDSRKDTGAGLGYTEKNGEKGEQLEAGIMLMPKLFEQ